jgi:hypothetical protein
MNQRKSFVKREKEGRAWLQDDVEEEDVHFIHCKTYQIRFKYRFVNYLRQSTTNELQ